MRPEALLSAPISPRTVLTPESTELVVSSSLVEPCDRTDDVDVPVSTRPLDVSWYEPRSLSAALWPYVER